MCKLSYTTAITVRFEQSQYSANERDVSTQLVLVLSNSSSTNIIVYIASPRDG